MPWSSITAQQQAQQITETAEKGGKVLQFNLTVYMLKTNNTLLQNVHMRYDQSVITTTQIHLISNSLGLLYGDMLL